MVVIFLDMKVVVLLLEEVLDRKFLWLELVLNFFEGLRDFFWLRFGWVRFLLEKFLFWDKLLCLMELFNEDFSCNEFGVGFVFWYFLIIGVLEWLVNLCFLLNLYYMKL